MYINDNVSSMYGEIEEVYSVVQDMRFDLSNWRRNVATDHSSSSTSSDANASSN
jgi:hypothetical protein